MDDRKNLPDHEALSSPNNTLRTKFRKITEKKLLYRPWERGINENTNGLLRRTLPKGTDLSVHSQAYLDAIAFRHNSKPSKSLGWKSPAELFLPEGSFDFQAYWSKIINLVALGT